jgi:hypothetical protein
MLDISIIVTIDLDAADALDANADADGVTAYRAILGDLQTHLTNETLRALNTGGLDPIIQLVGIAQA